jgi:capsular exopolysaccharide synthesis family protein
MNDEQAPSPPHQDDGLSIAAYLQLLRRRKWAIIAALAVGITVTTLYTLNRQKIYEATGSVVINPQAPKVFGNEVQEVVQLGTGNYWSNKEYYNTLLAIAEGFDLAQETVIRHSLHKNPKVLPGATRYATEPQRIRAATEAFLSLLNVTLRRDSQILEFHVRHGDPELAADLANKHIDVFIAYNLSLRTDNTSEAAKFLSRELDLAAAALRKAEDDIYAFKSQNHIISVSLEDQINQVAADLGRYSEALSSARIKRIDLASLRVQAQKAVAAGEVLESAVFALAGNTSIGELKRQYHEERRRLLEIAEDLGPRHPNHQAQEKKVAELLQAITRESQLSLQEIEQRYQAAVASEEQFQKEVARLEKDALELDAKSVHYKRLTRTYESDAENYKIVLNRLRDSQLSAKNQLGNIVPHTRARAPRVHVEPNLRVSILLAGVFSLFVGVVLAFAIDVMDRTLTTVEQVEQAAQLPVLGVVPVVGEIVDADQQKVVYARDLYVFRHPASRAAECARAIRTNLLFSAADRPLKTLTLSSPNPREGKTTTVIYLGTTMAQSGQRVLLVDTDMRKPRLHRTMGISRDVGLSSIMLGQAEYADAIKSTEIPNLFVLPCGPTPPNPAELLVSNRFRDIMRDLREQFDRVLFDSPPLQAVTDAVVLGRLSDGVILVAQSGRTHSDHLRICAKQLRDVNAPLLGVIFNDVEISQKSYGYYYYNYNYGEAGEQAT